MRHLIVHNIASFVALISSTTITAVHMNQRLAFIKLAPRHSNVRTLHFSTHAIGTRSPSTVSYVPMESIKASKTRLYHSSPQRNFLGNNKNNRDDDDKSIIGVAKNIAKKILPSSWFQSEKERQQIAEQKQVQKDLQTGIQQLFKDAPLPVRMVSNMIAPIFGSMMSSLAETAASQQSLVDVIYDQAVQSIRSDQEVQNLLGDTITVGRPFSQSSSSSSINGVTSTRIELAFPVSGRLGNGVGQLSASGGDKNPIIDRLVVQANGRVINVNLFISQRKVDVTNSMRDKNNIIDAEIIEKDYKK